MVAQRKLKSKDGRIFPRSKAQPAMIITCPGFFSQLSLSLLEEGVLTGQTQNKS